MKKKLSKTTILFIFVLTAISGFAQDIVINEINYKSAGDHDTKDWVELYNNEATAVDVSNWVFKDEDNTHEFIIPSGTIMNPNTYLVLTQDLAAFQTFFPSVSPVLGDLGFGFSGNSELLRIFNDSGSLLDEVTYDDEAPWPTEPDGDGNSLELIHPSLDNTIGTNWGASITASTPYGTPGAQNSVYALGNSEYKINQFAFKLFPNPMQNESIISIKENYNIVKGLVSIYDMQGKKVQCFSFDSNSITIKRGNLTTGNYIVSLSDDGAFLGFKKLVVK